MLPAPPKASIPWLTCLTSLTQKLREHAGEACMQVLMHKWEIVNQWDKEVLRLSNGAVIHREILMQAHQQACWYARTIIPEQTMLADPELFDRLNQEPLGQLIFHSGSIQRVSLRYGPVDFSSEIFGWLPVDIIPQSCKYLWRRLSTFSLVSNDARFYLLEILLPGLEQYW